jgi:serine/threonine protein kinase
LASHHFQVTQKVHATAVSQIYEAVSPDGCRSFLEVLHASSAGSWLDAFRRDLAAAAQLRHPCLLEVLEIGAQPDGSPVIIYERPVGISLGRWLARGHVAPTDAAMDLLAGLAHALGCLHDAGVSHGALTADDVMLVEISQHALGFPRLRGFRLPLAARGLGLRRRTDHEPGPAHGAGRAAGDRRRHRRAGGAGGSPADPRCARARRSPR